MRVLRGVAEGLGWVKWAIAHARLRETLARGP